MVEFDLESWLEMPDKERTSIPMYVVQDRNGILDCLLNFQKAITHCKLQFNLDDCFFVSHAPDYEDMIVRPD